MSTSPISKMNDDCLLLTFDFITLQMPASRDIILGDRPLKTIRKASQTCHRWRELLLSSPVLWGRLVDLDIGKHTFGPRAEWMEEVVRRTGSSPLWIYGNIVKSDGKFGFDSWSLFIDLLQSWERIEKLSVAIHGESIPDAMQNRFLSPAPMLKSFDVYCPLIDPLFLEILQSDSSQYLFGNYAPSLRAIHADRLAFKPNAPWLSGIREIVPIPPSFSLQDLFVLLQHTPLLQSIIVGPESRSCVGSIPSIKPHLPHLSSIIMLNATFGALARILDYISPRKLSVFRIFVFDFGTRLEDDYIIPSLRKNLPVYIASYFNSHPPPVPVELQLKFITDTFALSDANKQTSSNSPRQGFEISLYSSLHKADQINLMTCISDSLLQASTLGRAYYLFESIIGLTLHLSIPNPYERHLIFNSMLTFRDIEYIRISEESGGGLWSISADNQPNCVLFPKLRTVFLTSVNLRHQPRAPKHVFRDLTDFLKYRKEIGFPVQRLDLTTCILSYYAKDLSALEDIDGLEVVWKTSGPGDTIAGEDNSEVCSYICGSGDPEKLVGIF